jgi:hypothetical protein
MRSTEHPTSLCLGVAAPGDVVCLATANGLFPYGGKEALRWRCQAHLQAAPASTQSHAHMQDLQRSGDDDAAPRLRQDQVAVPGGGGWEHAVHHHQVARHVLPQSASECAIRADSLPRQLVSQTEQ